jgi:thiol-disulfide isomerase/thioredoxin
MTEKMETYMKKSALILVLLSGSAMFSSCATVPGKLKYTELHSRDCSICNRMTPVLEAAAAKYSGLVEVESYGNTSDTGESLVEKYGIKRYPANIFTDRDGIVFFRYEGLLDSRSVEQILDKKIKNMSVMETAK